MPTSQSTVLNADCPEKCKTCSLESNAFGLCLTCNIEEEYYPVYYDSNQQIYIECLKREAITNSNLFFNPQSKRINLCYETCKTCLQAGNPEFHNCITCDTEHMFRPDNNPKGNCITNCKYFYYFTFAGQYKCTAYPKCPDEAKYFIKEKNKCVDECSKDSNYKYLYNGNCILECPEDTINENYLCVKKNTDDCTISLNKLNYMNFINDEEIETLVKSYTEEFGSTNNHISQYYNNDYNILILKNGDCVSELSLKISNVDFGICYNKTKEFYNIDYKDDLVLVLVNSNKLKFYNNPITTFALFDPSTGKKLDVYNICKNDTIIINENLLSFLDENDTNYNTTVNLLDQNINIFDPNDDFYTELCFYFISPIEKDIPLKDRLSEFYPNISLCDPGCKNIGINYTTKNAICDCKFNDISNNALANNIYLDEEIGEVKEILNKTNLEVLKCLGIAFVYFSDNYGGYIVLVLMACTITCTIFFYKIQYTTIKIYTFELTKNYLSLISQSTRNTIVNPPKKEVIPYDKEDEKHVKSPKKRKSGKKQKEVRRSYKKKDTLLINDRLITESQKRKKIKSSTDFQEFAKINMSVEKNINLDGTQMNEEFFNSYLSKTIEEMDYGEALKYDKRSFCESFTDLLLDKAIIFNTFCSKDPLKPLGLKIVILLLYINLYFLINGLFYSEEYISEVYHLEKKDKFFSFVPRSISRFLFTILVGAVVEFIIECLFVEESKIKRIFKRERENANNIKNDIVEIIKRISRNLIFFFVLVFLIYIFTFIYVICFNFVYHFTQYEWIKSTIFIFIVFEIIVVLLCLIATGLRFASFKCKSERIFKLSNILNEI